MVVNQRARSNRKPSGGMYKLARSKRKFEKGSKPTLTRVDQKHAVKTVKTKGNGRKMKVMTAKYANVYDPKTKKSSKTEVETVNETAANRHFVRSNIIVKGTIITTKLGKARVTSRPGQDGTVNAILV